VFARLSFEERARRAQVGVGFVTARTQEHIAMRDRATPVALPQATRNATVTILLAAHTTCQERTSLVGHLGFDVTLAGLDSRRFFSRLYAQTSVLHPF
jgi:hypothetical protein